jgi:hypothetical protein
MHILHCHLWGGRFQMSVIEESQIIGGPAHCLVPGAMLAQGPVTTLAFLPTVTLHFLCLVRCHDLFQFRF